MAKIDDVFSVDWTERSPDDLFPGDYIKNVADSPVPFEGRLIIRPSVIQHHAEYPELIGAWSMYLKDRDGLHFTVSTKQSVMVLVATPIRSNSDD